MGTEDMSSVRMPPDDGDGEIDNESFEDLIPDELPRQLDPTDSNALEMEYLGALMKDHNEALDSHSGHQKKFSDFVMGLSLRVAGSNIPDGTTGRGSVLGQKFGRAFLEAPLSLDGNLSRALSQRNSVNTVQSVGGGNATQKHLE